MYVWQRVTASPTDLHGLQTLPNRYSNRTLITLDSRGGRARLAPGRAFNTVVLPSVVVGSGRRSQRGARAYTVFYHTVLFLAHISTF